MIPTIRRKTATEEQLEEARIKREAAEERRIEAEEYRRRVPVEIPEEIRERIQE